MKAAPLIPSLMLKLFLLMILVVLESMHGKINKIIEIENQY